MKRPKLMTREAGSDTGFSNQDNTLGSFLYIEMDIMNPDNSTSFI